MTRRLLILSSLLPTAVLAQTPGFMPGSPPRAGLYSAGDPADRLAGYLRTLAASPRDVEALTGAGRAALDVGDANAAIGFYARADGLAPRTGRIKAGLGIALLRMGKAREALRLFDQAVDLGVPEVDLAADRGLAWDLRGEPKRAQRDYHLALAAGSDAETTRRLALSLAIGGDQPGAIQLLTPLLYKNDPAAWRARAFVLAMTGDPTGAGTIAAGMMLPGQAAAMQPFLTRLGTLDAAEKARAVHFGEMPSDGTRYSPAELAGFGGSTATRTYRPEASTSPPRAAATRRARPPAGTVASIGRPSAAWMRDRTALLRDFTLSPTKSGGARADAVPAPQATLTPLRPAAAGRTVSDADDLPLVLALNAAGSSPPDRRAGSARTKPTEDKAAAKKKAEAAARKQEAAAEARAQKTNPERIWVQVAGGANRADLPRAWAAAKAKSPDLLRGKSASIAKARATNRLLVGPFKSENEAQALVNKLAGAFIVTTEQGEPVEKLAAK